MKRAFAAAAALLALSAAPAFAGSHFDGFYVGADLGHESTDLDASFGGLTAGFSATGVVGGVFAGYGMTFGDFYLGGEVGYDRSEAEAEALGLVELGFTDSFALTARVGYMPVPDLLVYGLGGYEASRYKLDTGGFADDKGWVDGLRIGLGAEYGVAEGIFLRGEYSHTFTDEFDLSGVTVEGGRSVFKAGLGYRF